MREEDLYAIVKEFLEAEGFYPVKTTPSVKIRGYKPDVVGLKRKKIVCVEVKLDFNERSLMEAVTQAKVYMLGTTHVYIAFPSSSWQKGRKDIKQLAEKLCNDAGIGIYLINTEDNTLKEQLKPKFSPLLNLDDYDSTMQQLEGREWILLENTYPEYIRDVCICLSKLDKELISREELSKILSEKFDGDYWLKKSHSPAEREKAIENRIKRAITGAIELGFIDEVEEERENLLKLSYIGNILAQLADEELDTQTPKELNDKTLAFFSAYLLRFPIYRMAIEILQEAKRTLPLGQSLCRRCNYNDGDIKKFRQKGKKLICPRCGSNVDTCIVHLLQLEHGKREYWWPINFTKTLHDKPLHIFDFPKIGKLDGIKLKKSYVKPLSKWIM